MAENSFEQVKRLMKIIGGKAIIIEEGKPSFVIINADEYMDFDAVKSGIESDAELIEKINKDITIWKNKQREKELKQIEIEKEFAQKRREEESVRAEFIVNDANP